MSALAPLSRDKRTSADTPSRFMNTRSDKHAGGLRSVAPRGRAEPGMVLVFDHCGSRRSGEMPEKRIGVQFHPTVKSRRWAPYPLFASLVDAAVEPESVGLRRER